jgi:hypothetical protein
MKSRKELKREYKERQKPAGVFRVKNTANNKVLLGSSLNLEGSLNKHRFMLTKIKPFRMIGKNTVRIILSSRFWRL